jgi:hypothetical protein
MQTFGDDVEKALEALHDMTCKRLAEAFADCNFRVRAEHLEKCFIALPFQIQCPSECTDSELLEEGVSIDMPVPEEALEALET